MDEVSMDESSTVAKGLTVGTAIKYLNECGSIMEIAAFSNLLEGSGRIFIQEIEFKRGKEYKVIMLLPATTEEGSKNIMVKVPFKWAGKRHPKVSDGLLLAKTQFIQESMV